MIARRRVLAVAIAGGLVVAGATLPTTATQALAPDAQGVYVSNNDDDTVSVIDPATNDVIETVEVGDEPRNLAGSPDRSTVYVPNRHSDNLSIIDTDTNTVADTIEDDSFDEPYAVAFSPDGATAYVANKEGGGSSTGSVTVIDTASRTVSDTIDDECFVSPEAVVFNPVLAEAYVVSRQGDSVCMIDTTTNNVGWDVNVGNDPRYAVVTPDGSAMFVANNGGDITRVTISNGATTTIDTDGFPRNMALSSDGTKVYAALQTTEVAVVTVSDNSVDYIEFTESCSTYGVAIVPGTNLGYVTDECDEVVLTFDAATDTETDVITDDGFDTPRAIAAIGVQPPTPPTTSTTAPSTTSTTTTAASPLVTPRFTG